MSHESEKSPLHSYFFSGEILGVYLVSGLCLKDCMYTVNPSSQLRFQSLSEFIRNSLTKYLAQIRILSASRTSLEGRSKGDPCVQPTGMQESPAGSELSTVHGVR